MPHSDEPLVTRKDLEELVDNVDGLDPYRVYMKKRWIGMVMWWHTRSVRARANYFLTRAIIIVGGVTIPVLTTLSMRTAWQETSTVTIAIVGAIVAGCAAWEGVANYGETWREKRRAAELLKVEGWQFIELSGKYRDYGSHKSAFPYFAAEVEDRVAREIGEYLTVFNNSLIQSQKESDTVLNSINDKLAKLMQ